MNKTNLILAAATKYEYNAIQPFLTSLRKTGYQDKIVFLVGGNDKRTLELLKEEGVESLKIPTGRHLDNRYSWKIVNSLGLSKLDFCFKLFNYICNRRYFYFRDFLLSHPNDFNHILITDVRDVLFQKDPFANFFNELEEEHIHFFEEEITFQQDPTYNSFWVEKIYGKRVLQSMSEKKVICVGTILGKQKIISNFLNSICREFKNYNVWGLGLDQGAINRMIYDTDEFQSKIHKNGDHIFTVGFVNQLLQDENEMIVNQNNEVVPIVHQYDRHEYLNLQNLFT